ncbi:MAG: M61 family peptidase [Terracidiphilus sp.]
MTARSIVFLAFLLSASFTIAQKSAPIQIRIDFTDAPRRMLHITEKLRVYPGINTFAYPEWIPSQELPGGPIENLTGLYFHVGSLDGPTIAWRRDLSDAYKFHVNVPADVKELSASYDILDVQSPHNTTGTAHASLHLAMLEPHEVVLYPMGMPLRNLPITATIHLPATWKAATALRTGANDLPALNGPDTTFKTVSVEQFIDSPILAGDHCRQYPLAPEIKPIHTLDVCADKESDLDLQPVFLSKMTAVVEQATKLFIGHHYEHFDFLVADSAHLQGDSAEHTQSADYIVRSLDMSNPENADFVAYLLPHEYTHAWCGKYRRPAGEATADDNTPMKNDLIWVYEGFTQYYGNVLAARAGFRTPEMAVGGFDDDAFQVDKPGRKWRSIQDSADASAILRGGERDWLNWRTGQDFYPAGTLLWLDADMTIRNLTHGAKSLDDFAVLFFAPPVRGSASRDTAPGVLPYTFDDLVRALNTIAPYDWKTFWETRLNALDFEVLTKGLTAAGYDYVYQDTPSANESEFLSATHAADHYHSIGLQSGADGAVKDVWVGSPAYIAGLGPGDKMTAVNGKPYTSELLTAAVHDSVKNLAPIMLTAMRDDESLNFAIDYHGGEKYEALVRNSKPDTLTTAIFQPK